MGNFCIAGAVNPQGLAVVETQHDHQAFAVGLAAAATDSHIKPLIRCQEHEIPYIFKRAELNLKRMHP